MLTDKASKPVLEAPRFIFLLKFFRQMVFAVYMMILMPSAGGGISALLGCSGNSPDYEEQPNNKNGKALATAIRNGEPRLLACYHTAAWIEGSEKRGECGYCSAFWSWTCGQQ